MPASIAMFVIALLIAAVAWLIVRMRSPRPEFAPLPTAPDDPLMLAAMERARASRGEFLERLRRPREHALVKLHFVSSSQQVEHLWAEVLQVISDAELEVRLVTPPVTHKGHLDRVYRCQLEDVEDWQVLDADGAIHGGFTQRAMFAIARRDGVTLPPELLAQEPAYRDPPPE